MGFLSILLLPFTFLYALGMRLRNHLYNIGYSRSFNFDIMVINVGNLSVGGTGKTPMVEYLIRLLSDRYSLATLSRGYKRKTRGFRIANASDTAVELGDEPFQFYLKYGKKMTVTVCEERAIAIPRILLKYPETQLILLDDGYQHRTVLPDFNILLTTYAKPFYEDLLLPSGRLRETRSGAKRASAVVVTKCPAELSNVEQEKIIMKVKKYIREDTPVYFAYTVYHKIKSLYGKSGIKNKVILFSGIANPQSFYNYIKQHYDVVKEIIYPDHKNFSLSDIQSLIKQAQTLGASLLTTEKDAARLYNERNALLFKEINLFYLPIELKLIKDGKEFDGMVLEAISKKYMHA